MQPTTGWKDSKKGSAHSNNEQNDPNHSKEGAWSILVSHTKIYSPSWGRMVPLAHMDISLETSAA